MLYTEEIHAERLLEVLQKDRPCNHCIAFTDYRNSWNNNPCLICRSFIRIKGRNGIGCPCNVLGSSLAVEKSWEALREKGYIK